MEKPSAILIDYEPALVYCQPSLEGHDTAHEVIDYIHTEGIQLDMRKSCWRNLTTSLTNTLGLFQYLKEEATALLREHDAQQALEKLQNETLTRSKLGSQDEFTLNDSYMPDIRELRDAVEEMGIKNFRAYADDQVQNCTDAQTRLDIILDRRFTRGGQSVGLFEATIESQFNQDRVVDLLTTAYIWGTDVDGYLLTNQTSTIYSRKDDVYESMDRRRFKIISLRDIKPYIP